MVIFKEDSLFPIGLKELPDCPDMIFVLGNSKILNNQSISIVGTRRPTEYGKCTTKIFSQAFAQNNIMTVSGSAIGVDTIVHEATLDVSGITVAVLAYGFNHIKGSISKLTNKIIKNGGAVISEYLYDTPPSKFTFPHRNRIIASLSKYTLITEAALNSGSLITADFANKLKRKLFVIPGNINSNVSAGCNELIQKGANIALTPNDILKEFSITSTLNCMKDSIKTLPENLLIYNNVYSLLSNAPAHIEVISSVAHQPISNVLSALTILELNGYIEQLANKYFKIK